MTYLTTQDWSDKSEARKLINGAKEIIGSKSYKRSTSPYYFEIMGSAAKHR